MPYMDGMGLDCSFAFEHAFDLDSCPFCCFATCHLMVAQNVSQGPLGINWQRFFGHGSRFLG